MPQSSIPVGPARARPARLLSGVLRGPGDKSVSHRAILFAAMAEGETTITGLLEGDDVLATVVAARALGARVTREGAGQWRVRGVGAEGFGQPERPLDFGNSGTGCRLTMGAVAGYPIKVTFVGDASLSSRPMDRVLEPLRAMGVVAHDEAGRLPAMVQGRPPLRPIAWISKTASAQVKSAVLLAGLAADGVTEFVEPAASRDHTERMLRQFGVLVGSEFDGTSHWRRIEGPARLTACTVEVPVDPSSAAFACAAAVIAADADVTLEAVMANPTRIGFYETLSEMGADVDFHGRMETGAEPTADVHARTSELEAIDVPPERAASMIDEYPILAVCAAFAHGVTTMRGIGELRVKESDRIAATAAMLRAGGVEVDEFDDGLAVHGQGPGGPAGGGHVVTHGDHRIAMAALVMGLGAKAPMQIDDAAMIATSYPGFFSDLGALGADFEHTAEAT